MDRFRRSFRNRLSFRSDAPAVAGMDEWHVAQFIGNHLKSANLQNKNASTEASSNDLHFRCNEEFWQVILQRSPIRQVELKGFQVVDWYPRAPGVYYTDDAERARRYAEEYIREEQGIRFYDPDGKFHMIEGGIGSVRFKPIQIDGDECWLSTATSDGYCHSGIPLAVPEPLMIKVEESPFAKFNLRGRIKYLPTFLEQHFYHLERIPQLYLFVEELEISSRDPGSPVQITPMVFFKSQRTEFTKQNNVTYVTCASSETRYLNEAADWLKWYVIHYEGTILTNFDQQRLAFRDVPFSLQNVMTGKLDANQLREYRIENANIVCDQIQTIYSETFTMKKNEIKIGKGATINGNIVAADSIKNSFNEALSTNISDELKQALKSLTDQTAKLVATLPEESAKQVAQDVETLAKEAVKKQPRKKWWELALNSIKEVAKTVGNIGKPVLDLLPTIIALLTPKSI